MTKERIPLIIAIVIVMAALIILAIALITCKKEGGPETEGPATEGPVAEEVAIAEEIYGISGEIKEVYLDRILSVEANILLADPMKEPIKQMVKIKVTDQTKILKLKFPEEIPEGSTEPIIPEETEISFDDLKVGDKIDIETINNISENIKNKTEIIASVINVVE
jgi:heme/copper-type cytochrome/quinol oxidase subunit 2